MTARAQSAARTADRILDATLANYAALPFDALRLEQIATDAGVTVQTVLRRFGSKSALVCALVVREAQRIADTRAGAPPADLAAVVAELVDHYERYGALISKMYAEAPAVDGLPELAQRAREGHTEWCASVLRALAPRAASDAVRLAQLVVALDATSWRILRLERELSQEQTAAAIHGLAAAAVDGGGTTPAV